jgi:hypothetical protein
MTTATLESSIDSLRDAVAARMAATDPSDPKLAGYKPPILAGCKPAEECAAEVLNRAVSCCDGQRMRGDSLLKSDVHPTSQEFFDLCDQLKATHAGKSKDYGCPSGTDPLANIRNGAKFVGIPAWRAAMVRLSDKVTRLATFNATGSLRYEGVEDTLVDLASYALLSLLLYREEVGDGVR